MSRGEITEEAFAAQVAKSAVERAAVSQAASIEFAAREARFVRLVIRRPHGGEPCIDELEVYGPDSPLNLALMSLGRELFGSDMAQNLVKRKMA